MATLTIHPIHVQSKGGYPVLINGINPLDHDCIVGEVKAPAGLIQARWNLGGLMRNGEDSCNLDMNAGDLPELCDLARKLGAS